MLARHRCGFTLIELSIVLVIAGLLTGGILVGRDLTEVARGDAVGVGVDVPGEHGATVANG